MKVEAITENGTSQSLEVESLIITLSNSETLEISDEMISLNRELGIYPMASDLVHMFPRKRHE